LHAGESAAGPAQASAPTPETNPSRETPGQGPTTVDPPRRTQRSARNPSPAKEKTDDAPLQQQIGFDF
jgi:hypothetical protein